MPDIHPPFLDEIDRQLIAALQINARESVAMLARQMGIARTTVTSRLARLEKANVITGYGVRLGQRVVDGGLQAYVGITVQPRSGKEVLRRLGAMAQVQRGRRGKDHHVHHPQQQDRSRAAGLTIKRPSRRTSRPE